MGGTVGRAGTPGIVTEWDDPRGVGTVRTADGRDLPFQCTDLADGSRTTTVGARVTVAIVPGHHGRWQAVAITPEG